MELRKPVCRESNWGQERRSRGRRGGSGDVQGEGQAGWVGEDHHILQKYSSWLKTELRLERQGRAGQGQGSFELQAKRKQPQTQSEWVRKTLGQLWDYSLDDVCQHKIHLVWWFSC